MIREVLQGHGAFDLRLRPDTPADVVDQLVEFGHIVVTDAPVDPDALGDTGMLAAARYSGVVYEVARRLDLSVGVAGHGLLIHLGDQDGKGDILEVGWTASPQNFTSWVTQLLGTIAGTPSPLQPGTITAVAPPAAGELSRAFQFLNRRQILDYIVDYYSAAYRVRPDGKIDAGPESSVFRTTPQVVLADSAASDPQVEGLPATVLDVDWDAQDWTSRVVLFGEGQQEETVVVGTADAASNPYKDLFGNQLVRKRPVSSPITASPEATQIAQAQLNRFVNVAGDVTAATDHPHVQTLVQPGDRIWVWHPEGRLRDDAQQTIHRGQMLSPLVMKVYEVSWPVRDGMGVYYRTAAGSYLDLTPFVVWESGQARLKVGAPSKRLVSRETPPVPERVFATPVTSLNIADGSVTDTKIVSLSADKITAGTLSADVILGGTIRTDVAPNERMELSSTGNGYFKIWAATTFETGPSEMTTSDVGGYPRIHFYGPQDGTGKRSQLWMEDGQIQIASGTTAFDIDGTSKVVRILDGATFRINCDTWWIGQSATVAGPRYLSWYLSDQATRSGWFGYGGSNDDWSWTNERPLGNVFVKAHNGTAVVTRIGIDADGATLHYGSTGAEVFRLNAGYVRLAAGVAIQFAGTTVPRLEVGANNSIQATTPSGWMQIGPQNTSYCHIYTDRPAFYFNKSTLYANGSLIWHAGNDGSGSGLDADLLDGVQGANYLRSDVSDTFNGAVLYAGSILPRSDNAYNLGSSTRRWATVYRLAESSSSDRRVKKHISDQVPGLDLIRRLRPRRYRYRRHTGEWWWGLIAQEVADVVDPERHALVHVDDDMWGLNYEQLIAPMIRAIQELADRVDRLETIGG